MMKKLLLKNTKKSLTQLKFRLLFVIILMSLSTISIQSRGQTTVFDETFGNTAVAPYSGGTATVPTAAAYTFASNGAITTKLNGSDAYLNFNSSGVAGKPNLTFPFSSLPSGFNTTLSQNTSSIIWTVNMRASRTMSSSSTSYSDAAYSLAIVLCASNANLTAGTGSNTKGYALILQRHSSALSANPGAVRLVKFNNGIGPSSSGSEVSTPIIETPVLNNGQTPNATTGIAATATAPNNVSIKVVYTPSTNTWEMFYREDPFVSASPFADPSAGTLTSAGSALDPTYTSTPMTHFGYLASLSTSTTTATNQLQIDNFKMVVDAVTPLSFYYYKGTGSLASLSSWGSNADGSGTNPSNFSSNYQRFVIKNTTSVTTDAPWVVSGTGSKIIVGDPSSAGVTLTVDTLKSITGYMDITDASSGSNSLIVEDFIPSTIGLPALVLGSLHANSEVHYKAKGYIYGAFTYGKLFVDGGLATDTVSFYGTPHRILTSFNIGANSTAYFSSTSAYYLDVSSAAVTIAGTVMTPRVTGFVSSNVALGSANAALQFSGAENLTLSPGSTIEFQRGIISTQTTVQTVTPRSDYKNLKLSGSFAPKVFGTGTTTVSGVLTLNSGVATTTITNLTPVVIASTGTLALSSGVLTGSGNITLADGAKISKADGSLDVAPVYAGGASVEYNGTTAATSSFELPSMLNNLTINNDAGVTLTDNTSASGTLTLTKGLLTVPVTKTLDISSGTIVGGSASSYVNTQKSGSTVGVLSVSNISGTKTIPVGTATNYLPVTLTPTTTSGFLINAFEGATTDATPGGTAISDKTGIVDAIWNISRYAGTGNCAVTLGWTSALEGSSFAALADDKIGIANYTGTAYSNFGGAGSQSANTATQTLSTFGPLSVGTITTPLPVKLINFAAKAVNNKVSLNWQTTSEVNLSAYLVQRSTNGQDFETLTSVKAKNTAGVFDYSFIDYSAKFGVNYYRLVSVDIDGTTNTTNPVAVTLGASATSVTAYPNPTVNQLNVTGLVAGDHVKLLDLSGRIIKEQAFSGSNSSVLNLEKINAGIYLLVVENSGNLTFRSKIVKN